MTNIHEFSRREYTPITLERELFIDKGTYQPSPEVAGKVYGDVEQLGRLPEGWDGANALAPTESAIRGAIRWVGELFRSDTPKPDVFPMPNGNIQIEWSCYDLDIEIEVESISTCYVSYEDNSPTHTEAWERQFTFDIGKLAAVMDELGSRHTNDVDRPAKAV